MSELKELLGNERFVPSAGVEVPIIYIKRGDDKDGVRFRIPAIPDHLFPEGKDELQCFLVVSLTAEGKHTSLAIEPKGEVFFFAQKGKETEIKTVNDAFEDSLHSLGVYGNYVGRADFFYTFLSDKKHVSSHLMKMVFDFPKEGA